MKTKFSDLTAVPFLRKRIDDLGAQLAADPESVVPWVGAGMSARYGMPLWSTFVGDLIAKLPEEDRPAADHLRTHGFYDLAADFAHMRLGGEEFDPMMVRSFHREFDSTALHPIARLHPRLVVTTNYDRIIEQTMPWLVPLLPHTFRLNAFRDEDVLLKVHGTIEKPESWVLTRFQYATAYRETVWSELRDLFANRTVLFVGCSLGMDMFLDALRNMPSGRAPRHFAILNVASEDEAAARGRELRRLGIAVIPYITDHGDHSIVERILDAVRPSRKKVLSYVERLRLAGNYDRAMRVLSVESIGVKDVLARTRLGVKMAEVLRSYRDANPDPSSWSREWVLRWARAAADLGQVSELVTGAVVDIFRLAGQRDPELEQRLDRLRQPAASGSVSATADRDVQTAYLNLRAGNASALLDQIGRILRRGEYAQRPGVAERLEILRLKSLLALGLEEEANRRIEHLPPSVRPFGEALIAFARHASSETIAALDVLDSRWRASSHYSRQPGLSFSLSLRTLAHLTLLDYAAAGDAATRALAAHDPNARKAARLFRKGIPSELCYDTRRLGSSELLAILYCREWLTHVALRGEADEKDLATLRELVHRLEREKTVDRLLRWYWVLFAQLLPDSATQEGELQRTFDELMREAREEGSHVLLGEITVLFRTAMQTAFRDSIPQVQFVALGLG